MLLRNDSVLPLRPGASMAVIGPNADDARHLLGDYTHPVHVESLRELLRSGRNVFDIPMADETTLDAVDVGGATVLSELMTRLGAGSVRPWLRRQQPVA